jgi:hypothetical protein
MSPLQRWRQENKKWDMKKVMEMTLLRRPSRRGIVSLTSARVQGGKNSFQVQACVYLQATELSPILESMRQTRSEHLASTNVVPEGRMLGQD